METRTLPIPKSCTGAYRVTDHKFCIYINNLFIEFRTCITAYCSGNTVYSQYMHTAQQHKDTPLFKQTQTVASLLCLRVRSYIYSVRVLSWESGAAALREIHRWLPFWKAAVIDVCVCWAGVRLGSPQWISVRVCVVEGMTGADSHVIFEFFREPKS